MSTLNVGAGGFATIQAAINASAAGDTIVIAAGAYNENLTINHALTFEGANTGVAGTDARGAESILNWSSGNAVTVTTTGAVVFDGLEFTGKNVIAASAADTNVTFTDSKFVLTSGGNGGNNFYFNQPESFTFTNNAVDATGYTGAFIQPVGDPADPMHSTVTVTGNTFTGHAGVYVPGDDNDVPVIVNLSDVHGTVSNNTFDGVDIGVLAGNGAGPLEISGNTFENLHRDGPALGNGNAAGVVFFQPDFNDAIDIHNNTFANSDSGVRTSGVPNTSVGGEHIVIDSNAFNNVTSPGLQPVGGALHFTNSTGTSSPGADAYYTQHTITVNGAGGADYTTIQDAINHASAGDTITVAAGTYNENVDVNKSVTIIGAGDSTIINGTFATDNGVSGSLADWLKTAPSYSSASGSGITIDANHVTVQNLQVNNFYQGVNLGPSADITQTLLQNVTIASNVIGVEKGPTSDITHFTVLGGSISDGYIGVDFEKSVASTSDGLADWIVIDGTDFSNLDRKGIYAEALSHAQIVNFSMDNVGQFGGIPSFGGVGAGGDGINLNLKEGEYSHIVIDNFTMNDVGASDKDGASTTGDKNGGAIVIEARDQGSYAATPGHYTGDVVISNGSITGTTSTGIQAGEPGQTNATPAVTITNVTVNGAEHSSNVAVFGHGDVTNDTQSVMTVNGTTGADTVVVNPLSTGDVVFHGNAGNDSFTGGAEHDTATYDATLSASSFGYDTGLQQFTVNAGAEGIDHLSNVEQVNDGAGHHFLLVGAGGYATIQAAVDAASAGDTVVVGAGTWVGANINKALTIVGSGTGETIITHAGAGNYGLQLTGDINSTVVGGHATVNISGIDFAGSDVGVRISSTTLIDTLNVDNSLFDHNTGNGVGMGSGALGVGNINITNSTFDQNGNGTENGDGDISLFGFVGNALLQNIVVHGGVNAVPTNANADIGIQINGKDPGTGNVSHAIGNVVFDNVTVDGSYAKVMVYIQGYDNLDGLDFAAGGTSITGAANFGQALYIDPTLGATSAHYVPTGLPENVDLSNVTVSNTVINGATGTAIGANIQADSSSPTVEGAVADNFIGSSGADLLAGADGDDSLTGAGGNDYLDGGSGKDTAHYSSTLTAGEFSYDTVTGSWIVTTGGAEGTDHLKGIERVTDGTHSFILVGGGSEYTTLSQGQAAATGGETVLVPTSTPSAPVDTNANANEISEVVANGAAVGITANATDAFNPVTYSLTADSSNGGFAIDANTGVVTVADDTKIDYETAPGHQYSITVQADNGNGGTSTSTFAIQVDDVAPGLVASLPDVAEGTQDLGSVVQPGFDPNVTYAIINSPGSDGSLFSLDAQGNLSFNSAPDFENPADSDHNNSYKITIAADDGGGSPVIKSYTFNVTDVALSPLVDGNVGANHVAEGAATGAPVGLTASASDGAGPTAFSILSDTSGGGFQVNGTTGVVTVLDGTKLDFETHASETIVVQAAAGSSVESQTFVISIDDVPPSIINSGNGNDTIDGTHAATGPQPGSPYASSEDDVIHGGGGNDTIDGLGGDDQLFGDAGNDTLIGNTGNDTLTGGAGNDVLHGGEGDDTLVISGTGDAKDVLDGGNGDDTIHVAGTTDVTLAGFPGMSSSIEHWDGNGHGVIGTAANETFDFSGVTVTGLAFIDGGAGNDTLIAVTGQDSILRGNTGNDNLVGGNGEDTLTGGAGNDTVSGGAGDDTIIVSGTQDTNDVIDGGADTDTLQVTGTTALTLTAFNSGPDTSVGVHNVEIWSGNGKELLGTSGNNTFDFTGVTFTGGALTFIDAGLGNDTVIAGDGHNYDLRGNKGDDTLTGGDGDDILVGGAGNDTLDGGAGSNTASYAASTIGVNVNLASNLNVGGDADGDSLTNIQNVIGSAKADILVGDANANVLTGGAGIDNINGGAGDDTIVISGTNDQSDSLNGGADDDTVLVTGTANVTLIGFSGLSSSIENFVGNGHNVVGTSAGNAFDFRGVDVSNVAAIDGSAGNDIIYASDDGLRLIGGIGVDQVHGGAGADTIVISGTNDQSDIFDGGSGIDTVAITGTGAVTLGAFNATAQSIESWDGNGKWLIGTSAANTFDLSGLTTVSDLSYVDGSTGNDVITGSNAWNGDLRGGAGDDTITGGSGNDVITGGAGNDILHGAGGNDTFVISGANDKFDSFDGGSGINTMKASGAVTLSGFDATADSIQVWTGTTNSGITGTAANETFNLDGLTTVTKLAFVDGGAGNDTIIGSDAWSGDLRGGAGNDTLHGGTGTDKLTGGAGVDTFVHNSGDGHDTVADFTVVSKTVANANDDHFDLTGYGTDYMADVHNHMTQVGKDVVIDFFNNGSDTLTIKSTTIAVLDAHQSDFLLH